jgi:hypothetical protein
MERKELLKSFTESVLYNAAKATGDISAIMPEMEKIKTFMLDNFGTGIDTESIEENNRRNQLKELENEKENAAASMAKLAADYTAADQNSRPAIIESIQREYETLNKTITGAKINRYPTWTDYESAWQKENENDFSPEIFGRLPFPEGTVSYIGARTGRGKTTAMVNIGIEALFPITHDTPPRKVLFISLEENQKQILRRFSLCLAYRNASAGNRDILLTVKNPYTGKNDPRNAYKNWKRGKDIGGEGAGVFVNSIKDADSKIKAEIENGNLVFFDGIGASMAEILAAVRKRNRGDLILLDYIQKIPASRESRSGNPDLERIREGSEKLIEGAKLRDSVIIAGAQFNRESNKTKSKNKDDEFTDADFRSCGDLEQDGHNLIGIGRTADKKTYYYGVIKSREGEATDEKINLNFAGGYSFMENADKKFIKEKPEQSTGQQGNNQGKIETIGGVKVR